MTANTVSVMMSIFNGMPYLPAAVESILSQKDVTLEFVIVNNGSTDETKSYLETLSDDRVKIIDNGENLGPTRSFNIGLQACTGEYIARLDADDLAEPGRLRHQAAYLENNPDVGLVGGQMTRISASGSPIGRTSLPTDTDMLNGRMIVANCFDHSSVCFRRCAAEQVGYYPMEHTCSQDFAFFSAIMRSGWKIANTPTLVSRVREHDGQYMAGPGAKREAEESAKIVSENFAWLTGQTADGAVGQFLYQLWSGARFGEELRNQVNQNEVFKSIFHDSPLTPRAKSYLAVFLFGGSPDKLRGIRLTLLRAISQNDASVLFSMEMLKRGIKSLLQLRT